MIDQGANQSVLNATRNGLRLGVGLAAMGAALAMAPSQAQAQQVVPGVDPECPIVAGEAICEGDLEDGIVSLPGNPPFDTLTVRNPDASIAPPGYFGIGVITNDRDVTINVEEGVAIKVFDDLNIANPAQAIIGIASDGFGMTINSAATITADGNGGPGLGIESSVSGGGSSSITNSGDINAFTSGESAIALHGRVTGIASSTTLVENVVINSGDLTAASNGTGERDEVTAGILAFSDEGQGEIDILNTGAISVMTGSDSFDSDFNGIAGGIVTNNFGVGSTTEIVNEGAITATGPQTHGIVGFGFDNSVSIENSAAISTNGVGSFGILAQGGGANGGAGSTLTVENSVGGDIDLTAVGGTATGIFGLAQTQEASVSISNSASITGTGDNLRGIGVSSFGAPTGGNYDFLVFNEGLIDLETELGFGITAFVTTEDDAIVNIVNLGDIILDDTTSTDSIGISGFLIGTDANAMSDGETEVTIFNSGAITMGAGNAIFAAADEVNVTNTGALSTTGDDSNAIELGSGLRTTIANVDIEGTDANTLSTVSTSGDRSSAVSFISGGDSIFSFNTRFAEFSTEGDDSHVLEVANFDGSSTNLGALNFAASTTGNNSEVFQIGIGEGNQLLISFEDAALSSSGTNSTIVNVEGLEANQALNSVIIESTLSTTGDGALGFDVGAGDASGSVVSYFFGGTSITTTGDEAGGIRLGEATLQSSLGSTGYTLTVLEGDISTQGTNSSAIEVGALVGDLNDTVVDLNLGDSTFTTTGDGSHGLVWGGFQGDITDTQVTLDIDGVTIGTSGDESHGFLWSGVTDDVIDSAIQLAFSDTSITTGGAGSHGLFFEQFTGTFDNFNRDLGTDMLGGSIGRFIELDNVNVTTTGDGSAGLRVGGIGNGTPLVRGAEGLETVSRFSLSWINSAVATTGNGSAGIDIAGFADANASISLSLASVTVATEGNDSAGFVLGSSVSDGSISSNVINASSFSTLGDRSDATVFGFDPLLGMDQANVRLELGGNTFNTEGDDSRGLAFDLSGGAVAPEDLRLIVLGSSVSTLGENSGGIFFSAIDGIVVESSRAFDDSAIGLTISLNTIETQGDNSPGLTVGGMSSDLSASSGSASIFLSLVDNSIMTSGANSAAIVLGDLPSISDDDQFNSDLRLGLREAISTTGENSDGVVIGANWGTAGAAIDDSFDSNGINSRFFFGEVSADVSATGTGSVGIRTASFLELLDITETGSITADTFAILSEGAGGIGTLNNAGTITGDLSFGDVDSTLNNTGTITGNIDMGGGTNAILIDAMGRLNSLDEILLGDGNTITVAGTIAPGDDGPLQTTMVGSNLVFETGSTFAIDIDGMAMDPAMNGFFASDRISVDGSITINGGTLAIASLTPEGDFDRSATFLILDAADGVAGEFDALGADLPFLDLSLTYNGGNVILNAGRQGPVVPFQTLGTTANQIAVGAAFDVLEMDSTGDLDVVVDQLIFASTPQALTAFDSTSGEIYATLLGKSGFDGLVRSREALARARRVAPQGWGIWGAVSGADGSLDADGNAAEAERNEFGFDFGIDYAGPDNGWAVGVAGGYRDGELEVAGRGSDAEYDGWYLAGSGRVGTGGEGFTLNAALTFSQNDANVFRSINVNALTRTAFGTAETETFSVAAEARYGFGTAGDWAFGPVAYLIYVSADLSDVSETGAQSLNLSTTGSSDDQTVFGVGAFANWQNGKSGFDLSAQYLDGGTNQAAARLAFEGGSSAPFTVLAPGVDNSGVLASASGQVELSQGWTVGAQVDGFFGDDVHDVSGSLVVGLRF